jgi:hypothetical protein
MSLRFAGFGDTRRSSRHLVMQTDAIQIAYDQLAKRAKALLV